VSEEPKKPFMWQLEPGDRVVFWDREQGDVLGTISKVTDAYFFPYWVDWDPPWRGRITEGGFQTSCFDWREMDRRGFRPDRPWRPRCPTQ